VGGFETLYPFSRVFQDIDLSRKIAHYYQMAQIGEIVCCIRAGDVGSTTNYPDMFLANRQSRENALNTSGASARLRASVFSSPSRSSYWYGRIIYYYLASLKWNVQRKRLLTSASRGIHILLFFAIANRHILSNDFWCGVMKPHLPVARIVIEKSGVNLYANTGWTEE
jgi:hypothetical protein